jgi:hypothetical protein
MLPAHFGEMSKGFKSRASVVALLRSDFVRLVYLPSVKTSKRTATARGYEDMWNCHFGLRAHIAGKLLKDVGTCEIQNWLTEVAATDRNQKRRTTQETYIDAHQSIFVGDL